MVLSRMPPDLSLLKWRRFWRRRRRKRKWRRRRRQSRNRIRRFSSRTWISTQQTWLFGITFQKLVPSFPPRLQRRKIWNVKVNVFGPFRRQTFDADTSLFDCFGVDQLIRSQLCWQNDCQPVLTLVCSKKYQKVEHFGQFDKKIRSVLFVFVPSAAFATVTENWKKSATTFDIDKE